MAVADSFQEDVLQKILEEVAQENGFEKPKYEVSIATKPGDNFLGAVSRAVVHETGRKKKDSLSMIFKTSPLTQTRRDKTRTGVLYRNEGNMYTLIFPAFNAFSKEHGLSDNETFENTARCLYMKLSDDVAENGFEVLVLEDMKAKGYAMVDRSAGMQLDVEQCRMILRRLARIHGTSLALQQHRPEEAAKLQSHIREVFFDESNPMLAEVMPLFQTSLDCIEDRYPKDTPEYIKLKKFVDNYLEEYSFLTAPNKKLSCVTHGDCWSNNMLFKFDKDGKAQDICLIDFQLSRVASPVCDIAFLLFTATNKKTRDAHYKSLLRGYHDDLTSVLRSFGCDPEVVCPWSLFQDQVKIYGRLGLGMAVLALPLFLADSSDFPDFDGMMEDGGNFGDAFTSITNAKMAHLKERLSDVLHDAIQLGYL